MYTALRLGYQIWQNGGVYSLANRVALSASCRANKTKQNIRQRFYLRDWRETQNDPRRVIYIDPNQVIYETRTKMGDILNGPNIICGGHWDNAITPFHERYKVNSLVHHFKKGVNWENTEYYQRLQPRIKAGLEWRGCSSTNELLAYLSRYDDLYETIRKDGYSLSSEPLDQDQATGRPELVSELSEIGVTIGRNGSIFWQSRGQHRLCIAQLLNLDEVPVQVLARHKEWQEFRKQSTNFTDKSRSDLPHSHPDFPR